jgi:hypothetical protein
MNYWVELIDVLIYFTGKDNQNELLGLIKWYVWFILSVRIIKINYWIELIDVLIYFTGNHYYNE